MDGYPFNWLRKAELTTQHLRCLVQIRDCAIFCGKENQRHAIEYHMTSIFIVELKKVTPANECRLELESSRVNS